VLVKGLFDRHVIDIIIGAVMALCFAYQFTVLLPHAGVGWQDHIGGLVAGIAGGWIFRDRRLASRSKVAAKPAVAAAGATTTSAIEPAGTSKAADKYAGPRADLHKQLDDLGI
jgi:hypothetical protein